MQRIAALTLRLCMGHRVKIENIEDFRSQLFFHFAAVDQPGLSAGMTPMNRFGRAMYEASHSPEAVERRMLKAERRFDALMTDEILASLYEKWKNGGEREEALWPLAQELSRIARKTQPTGCGLIFAPLVMGISAWLTWF